MRSRSIDALICRKCAKNLSRQFRFIINTWRNVGLTISSFSDWKSHRRVTRSYIVIQFVSPICLRDNQIVLFIIDIFSFKIFLITRLIHCIIIPFYICRFSFIKSFFLNCFHFIECFRIEIVGHIVGRIRINK